MVFSMNIRKFSIKILEKENYRRSKWNEKYNGNIFLVILNIWIVFS